MSPTFVTVLSPWVVAALVVGCQPETSPSEATQPARGSTLRTTSAHVAVAQRQAPRLPEELLLPWGSGEGQVGLVPLRPERPPRGPLSVALSPDGSVWVLDQVNHRIVHLDATGGWLAPLVAPPGSMDLAVDSLGRVAVLSLINHRVLVVDQGGLVEEIPVPIALRQIAGLSIDGSGRFLLETARQETFDLGREGARVGWPDILNTQIDGVGTATGGVATESLVKGKTPTLLTHMRGHKEPRRTPVLDADGLASMAIVGTLEGGRTVVVTERFRADDTVERHLRLVGPKGDTLAERPLAGRSLTFMFREMALSPDDVVIAMHSSEAGLTLRSINLGGAR